MMMSVAIAILEQPLMKNIWDFKKSLKKQVFTRERAALSAETRKRHNIGWNYTKVFPLSRGMFIFSLKLHLGCLMGLFIKQKNLKNTQIQSSRDGRGYDVILENALSYLLFHYMLISIKPWPLISHIFFAVLCLLLDLQPQSSLFWNIPCRLISAAKLSRFAFWGLLSPEEV